MTIVFYSPQAILIYSLLIHICFENHDAKVTEARRSTRQRLDTSDYDVSVLSPTAGSDDILHLHGERNSEYEYLLSIDFGSFYILDY